MSYTTPAKVKSLFRQFDEPANDPAVTDAEIQEWLDDHTHVINAKIGTLYELPITAASNPEAHALLGRIEAFLTAGIVDDVLNTYGEADKKPMWAERGMALLKGLVPEIKPGKAQPEPTMKLTDATYKGTRSQSNRISVNPKTKTPIFSRDKDNW